MKNNKAKGKDYITPDLIKNGTQFIKLKLVKLFTEYLKLDKKYQKCYIKK